MASLTVSSILLFLLFIITAFLFSSCTHSSFTGTVSAPHFQFSNSTVNTAANENFSGWWKLYTPKNYPESAVIEVLSRNGSDKIAIDSIVIPKGYSADGGKYTFASSISAFYASNASFECCRASFNESGTYYADEYLYNCSTLNDYFINACDSLRKYRADIVDAKPKGLHSRMTIIVAK